MTPTVETALEHPIKLPRFVLITGGVGSHELATALTVPQLDADKHFIHEVGVLVAAMWMGRRENPKWNEKIKDDVLVGDLAREFDSLLMTILGDDYAACGFINNYDNEGLDTDCDTYIIADAIRADVKPFVDRFAEGSVLVLETGPMQAAPCKNCIWLPSPDLHERLKLLKRELGVV